MIWGALFLLHSTEAKNCQKRQTYILAAIDDSHANLTIFWGKVDKYSMMLIRNIKK